jgi:type IV pilus assembly protein PilA
MKQKKGFTLLELLIVIAIIAIIAAIIFVALDPLKRFGDARDARRWSDIRNIVDAIKLDQVDNGGAYHANITALNDGEVYLVVDGAKDVGCDDQNANCDVDIDDDANCVNLGFLQTEGYLGDIAVGPSSGVVTWDHGAVDGDVGTGYTVQRDATGIITVRSCEAENTAEIFISR